jgi:hypothetical protein
MTTLLDGYLFADNIFLQIIANVLKYLRSIVLDVLEGFLRSIAIYYRVNHVPGFIVKSDVYGIGVSKKVMQITQNFLVGTYQKKADIVVIIFPDFVQGQILGTTICADKTCDLSIRVARYIGY